MPAPSARRVASRFIQAGLKEFNDSLVRPRSAMQYVYGAAGHVNDDGEAINERKEYLGEAANTILLKSGIIGRRAK
jgi:hypothetical protein